MKLYELLGFYKGEEVHLRRVGGKCGYGFYITDIENNNSLMNKEVALFEAESNILIIALKDTEEKELIELVQEIEG